MITKLTLSLACMLALSPMAHAADSGQTSDATVCTSAPYPIMTAATTIFNDKAEFTCGNKQKGSIPGFAKMGWHIVSIQQQAESNPMAPNPTAVTVLILEKMAK